MKRNLLFAGLFVACTLIFTNACRTLPQPDFHPVAPGLRVVTYNINWGGPNPDAVASYLKQANADVVFLQETHEGW